MAGHQITTGQGAVGPAIAVTLTGQQISVQQGVVGGGSGMFSPSISGQGMVAQQGNVSPGVAVGITGSMIQSLLGSVTAVNSNDLIDTFIQTQQGTVRSDIKVNLTGHQIAVSTGNVVPSGGTGGNQTVVLTGQQIAVQQGSVSLAPIARAITGQQIAVQQGSVTSGAAVAVTGSAIATGQGSVSGVAAAPPTGNFTGNPLSGNEPLIATFTDSSTGTPAITAWLWEKNGGAGWEPFATNQNPAFAFAQGTWSIRLTVTNLGGSHSFTRNNYVVVGAGTTSEYGGSGWPRGMLKRHRKRDTSRWN
jgi:PKD repeat protein